MREDMETALRELAQLIKDTDRRIKEAFEETFEAAAKNFEEVVGHLFPGGRGALRLVREDSGPRPVLGGGDAETEAPEPEEDEDEATPEDKLGVEIEITPAGKSTKRLTLLSGGEKSMTVARVPVRGLPRPPVPFYILDEVEAALDDLNIDRFLKVLRAFSGPRAVHRRHAPEAHDGGRRRVVRRVDGRQRRLEGHLPPAPEARRGRGRRVKRETASAAERRRIAQASTAPSASSAPPRSSARRAWSARRPSRARPAIVGSAAVAGSTCVVGSAGVALAAGVVGSAGHHRRPRQRRLRGLRRCIGCVNCRAAWAASAAAASRAAVGMIGVARVTDDPARHPEPASSRTREAAKTFYNGFLGFDDRHGRGRLRDVRSPSNRTAQITIADLKDEGQDRGIKEANVSVEVEDVDALHAQALEQGLEVVYPLTDEPWGVRRFFVESSGRPRHQRGAAPLEDQREEHHEGDDGEQHHRRHRGRGENRRAFAHAHDLTRGVRREPALRHRHEHRAKEPGAVLRALGLHHSLAAPRRHLARLAPLAHRRLGQRLQPGLPVIQRFTSFDESGHLTTHSTG